MSPPDSAMASKPARNLPDDLIHHALPRIGSDLAADTDHLLARINGGAVLLIHIPPGEYSYEAHAANEFIVCLAGNLQLETEQGRLSAKVGEMIEVPAQCRHRFAANCSAVVLTIAQKAA